MRALRVRPQRLRSTAAHALNDRTALGCVALRLCTQPKMATVEEADGDGAALVTEIGGGLFSRVAQCRKRMPSRCVLRREVLKSGADRAASKRSTAFLLLRAGMARQIGTQNPEPRLQALLPLELRRPRPQRDVGRVRFCAGASRTAISSTLCPDCRSSQKARA
mmetsp:Transcript_17615/g.45099  ORF Transcript_17615/g.45099 Transcript_17615/m.45099 type:complete len:164 (+) Transcript_17615:702-1193(+)